MMKTFGDMIDSLSSLGNFISNMSWVVLGSPCGITFPGLSPLWFLNAPLTCDLFYFGRAENVVESLSKHYLIFWQCETWFPLHVSKRTRVDMVKAPPECYIVRILLLQPPCVCLHGLATPVIT